MFPGVRRIMLWKFRTEASVERFNTLESRVPIDIPKFKEDIIFLLGSFRNDMEFRLL